MAGAGAADPCQAGTDGDLRMQIAPVAQVCLQQLAALLLEVCKNPMQPTFNHYMFESVAALIRHTASRDASQV